MSRYRQSFLFLAILILPGILIAVQGRRIAAQEEELARTRIEEARKRAAANIGQDIVSRLERIKTQQMANAPSDLAIAAVGWLDGEQLVWPWDAGSKRKERAETNPRFDHLLLDAKRAEFGEQRYDHAADFYRQAKDAAVDDIQRASAGLGLARTLARSGNSKAAAAACGDLLKILSTVTDDDGLSVWSSAATPCVEWGAAPSVLQRAIQDLESSAVWPPIQVYRLRTILEDLQKSGDSAVRDKAAAAFQSLAMRLKHLEQAEKLQKDFPKLRVTATEWQPYAGDEMWLVGRAPEGAPAKPLVLAIRWETIQQRIEKEYDSRHAGPRFQIAFSGLGEALSEYLPGLRVVFPEGIADTAGGLAPQRSFWTLSFAVVGVLTLLGGYLLWRDMRREAHMAELRTQFVSSVSHELKTPLTSIRMFAELLQMKESPDPEHSSFLDTIVSESERLTRLLNNVLDFSRIERGQKAYRLQPAALPEVVDAAVRTIQYPLAQQGFVLDMNVGKDIPSVDIDCDALQQAILNLLTNAMKYSGESREIGLHVFAENGSALIQVSDRGIGIPEHEQSRIFEKFYRARIPENHDISGTGLGLALVAHIAEAHGGSVGVKSNPGKGSTFSICIPLNGRSAA